ncbi:hypothetical protein PAECIP111893_04184 [Paenibacillus plantiphilus]|uniref:Multiple sugar transport system substrate-binding protein n=1 Tax=Paenibacillus plantiphilus TaxID=2905650 RepID=A0ABM9CMN5_9BACL|nr:extracellular solute-binding protein [Paenibacillus plantiphilus]CAH1216833.1 hypothetical protein PAECIP111893_04184 [Paenibacillus plantiphilus]
MNVKKKGVSFRTGMVVLIIIVLAGGGWLFRGELKQLLGKEPDSDIPAALRDNPIAGEDIELVVHASSYSNFELQLKKPFIIRHPSVRIRMAKESGGLENDPEKFMEWMDKEKPDVLQLPIKLYMKLASEGRLKPLAPYMQGSEFDVEAIHAPLVQLLREAGGGELYGLTPEFRSAALYVNEELFQEHGIPVPEAGIELDEVLQLAARFKGTGAFGLFADHSNPYSLVKTIGEASGLQALSASEGQLKATVQSSAWEGIWQQVSDGFREEWIAMPKPRGEGSILMKDLAKFDIFAQGEAAMMIDDDGYYYSNLLIFEKEAKVKLKWSTIPFHITSAANQGKYLTTGTIYAINAASSNGRAAWELIRFVNGEEIAKRTDLDPNRGLSVLARRSNMKSQPEEYWKAFYEMAIDAPQAIGDLKRKSMGQEAAIEQQLSELASERLKSVIEGAMSVEEALAELQEAVQTAIDEAKLKGSGEQP